ncbi:hypothetical protein CO230_02235 [Chryseobacterium sp. 6424]|uniref:glycosyltransferase n=1 Tax=Chryseobacterium sp. 6424 TaxID=2039166 RepID=UPI000EFC7D8C|nr:glycosyltransferase [Chryseobacterium sp. 6424]AYO57050.1 hypothetical protein CO230_02235 [Chryseobacterium sp. 6424]
MIYNKIIITNLPAFYKINLFNKIAEKEKIFVVFTGRTAELRNNDFFKKELIRFNYIDLRDKSKIRRHLFLLKLFYTVNYKELILGGWDESLLWMAAFISPKKKNSVLVESSIYESKTKGVKGKIKSFFLKRAHCAYVSGRSQIQLLKALGFSGAIKKTKGVGLFNIQPQPSFERREMVKNFLYVGRLSPEKNLPDLIRCFNELPNLNLHIVGFGPLDKDLKAIALQNIKFHGSVNNQQLHLYYQDFDVFILPSTSEVWGLVVEEALNNGMPVIVSNKVGCVEEVVIDHYNGLVFNVDVKYSLQDTILQMTELNIYNRLRYNISTMDFSKIATEQVKVYTE